MLRISTRLADELVCQPLETLFALDQRYTSVGDPTPGSTAHPNVESKKDIVVIPHADSGM